MYIKFSDLVDVCESVFDYAKGGCNDLKDDIIEEALIKYKFQKPSHPRVYDISEIKKFPIGTKLYHSSFGRGEIQERKVGNKNCLCSIFENGQVIKTTEAQLWNFPIFILEKP